MPVSKPALFIDVPPIDPAQYGVSATAELMRALTAAITATVSDTLRTEYEARYKAEIAQHVDAMVAERVEAELAKRVQAIYEQLILSRRRMFGRSSEAQAGQARLFDEADALAAQTTEADDHVTLPLPATTGPTEGSRQAATPKARGVIFRHIGANRFPA